MNAVVKVLVCGILFGSISPVFADGFEAFLERTQKSPQVLQKYKQRKQAFEAEGVASKKDSIVRGIFTEVSTWKFEKEWELAYATFRFLREVRKPLFSRGYEPNQEEYREIQERHAMLVNRHRLCAQEALDGVEAADDRLRYWFFQRQDSQPEENHRDIYKDAYKQWVKAQCAAICVERFQWDFWDNEWYNPYWPATSSSAQSKRIPLESFQIELSQFIGVRDGQPTIHPHITNELNLQEHVSLQDGFVTHKLLFDLCEQALGEFDALWHRKEPMGR